MALQCQIPGVLSAVSSPGLHPVMLRAHLMLGINPRSDMYWPVSCPLYHLLVLGYIFQQGEVFRFLGFLFWGHTWLTRGSALRNNFWQCSKKNMGCQGSNRSWLHTRQAPFLLQPHSGPKQGCFNSIFNILYSFSFPLLLLVVARFLYYVSKFTPKFHLALGAVLEGRAAFTGVCS